MTKEPTSLFGGIKIYVSGVGTVTPPKTDDDNEPEGEE